MTSLITSRLKRSPASRKSFRASKPKPLERIRRTARLEGAATKRARPGLRHSLGRGKKLLARFNRAGPCHHNHLLAADFQSVGKLDDRSLRPEASSRQLVGRTDAMNVFDSGQALRDCGYRNRLARPRPPPRSGAHRWSDARRSPSQSGVPPPAGSALPSPILALQRS